MNAPAQQSDKRRRILQWAVAACILGVLAFTAGSQISQIRQADFQLRWEFLVLAILCLCLAQTAQLVGWAVIVRRLTPVPPSWPALVKVFMTAWMSRYVPLGVTPFVTKFVYGRRIGIEPTVLGLSMVLENVLSLAAVLLVVLLMYPAAVQPAIPAQLVMVVAALTAGLILWPQGLLAVSNWLLVRRKREPLRAVVIGWRETSGWLLLYFMAAILAGAGFYFLLAGLIPTQVPLTSAIGLLNAASFVGLVTVVAPAGLGAREAALAGLLLPWFSWPVGVVLAAAARLWTIAVDGVWLAVVWLTTERRRRHSSASL